LKNAILTVIPNFTSFLYYKYTSIPETDTSVGCSDNKNKSNYTLGTEWALPLHMMTALNCHQELTIVREGGGAVSVKKY
jgi:hypothetical protein